MGKTGTIWFMKQIGLMREGELEVTKIPEFLENESLATDFVRTQRVDELL